MEQLVKKSIVDDVMQMINKGDEVEAILKKLKEYQTEVLERDLKILNSTLLPALQINIEKQKQVNAKTFTKQYLGLPQKAYSYVKLIESKQQKDKSKQKQQLPPFLPDHCNMNDTFANSKQLLQKPSIGVTQKTPNLSFLLASTIKSTFNGQHKATYPTIIYEGTQPHPIRNYGSTSMAQSKYLIHEGMKTLGGMKDSLTKIGLESVALKKRKSLSSSKFSQISPTHMRASNTRISKLEQPAPPAQPIQNPFVRHPSQRK